MEHISFKAGSTSKSILLYLQHATTNQGLPGLAWNSAGLTATFFQPGDASSTAITLATLAAVNSAFSSGGFKEIDATLMPGVYRLDLPDAAINAGLQSMVTIAGAANLLARTISIDLTANVAGEVASGAIAAASFAAGAIDATAIASNAITAAKIADGAIDAATFAAGAIDATAIANGAIDAATFAAGAIDATAIANGAIDAATFAAGAIDATAIANGAIDAATFAAGAIDATAIASNAITAAKIASAALTDAKFDVIPDLASDPGTTPSVLTALALLYASIRNASTTTATAKTIKNNAGATILTKTLTDDGTTFTASKVA